MLSSPVDLSQVRHLEELAFAGWPALETRDSAGWRLRFSDGYTKRANSINALGQDAQVDGKTVNRPQVAEGRCGYAGSNKAVSIDRDSIRKDSC
jgi:hypothetical protein